jgi:hypothetical protein
MANTYFRGQGKIWIASRDSTGRTSGFTEIGDAEALSIAQSETYDSVNESQTGARVKVVHSAVEYNMDFEMTVLNFSAANLSKAILGTSSVVVGAAVTGESHKAYKGGSIFLKYPGVSLVTIGALVSGTDYVVDAVTGRIDFPTGSSITDGAAVSVNYTHGGAEGVIQGVTATTAREYVIIFEGKNMNTQGSPVIVKLQRAYLNVSQALSLLSGKETARFTMGGSLLPAGEIVDGTSQFLTITVKDFV